MPLLIYSGKVLAEWLSRQRADDRHLAARSPSLLARAIRDIALAFLPLAGPDGLDAFSSSAPLYPHGVPFIPLRIGWITDSGLGPVDPDVAAVVKSAAEALQRPGIVVEHTGIPALKQDFTLDVSARLRNQHEAAAAGRQPDELDEMAKTLLALPAPSVAGFIEAEQAAERVRDGTLQSRFTIRVTDLKAVAGTFSSRSTRTFSNLKTG